MIMNLVLTVLRLNLLKLSNLQILEKIDLHAIEYISNRLQCACAVCKNVFKTFSYKLHVVFHISVIHLNSPELLLIIVINRNFQKVVRRLFRIIINL